MSLGPHCCPQGPGTGPSALRQPVRVAPAHTRRLLRTERDHSAFWALNHSDGWRFGWHPILGHTQASSAATPEKQPLRNGSAQPSRSAGLRCSEWMQTWFPAHVSDVWGGSAVCSHVPSSSDTENPRRVSPMAQLRGVACLPEASL